MSKLFKDFSQTTRFRRAVLGLVAGAATGGILTGGWAIVSRFLPGHAGPPGSLTVVLLHAGLWWFWGSVAWGAGLVLLGLPAWGLLHRYGARTAPVAALTGAALAGAAVVAVEFSLNSYLPASTQAWAPTTLALTLWGALVGVVIWRIAYRRSKPSK